MRPLVLALLLPLAAACTPGASPDDAATGSAVPGAVTTRMVTDDSSGVELPRVSIAGQPEIEARVNASLDTLAGQLWCGSDVFPPGSAAADSSWTTRVRVDHAADDVLSVNIHSSYFCNTAYPTNDANGSVTYDLTTGEAVPFTALFRDYEADRAAITGLLSATLTPAASGDDGDGGCAETLTADALASSGFNYSLGADGLLVQPDFPHVIEACAAEVTVPYASLRAYARDGGVLARVADAKGAAE